MNAPHHMPPRIAEIATAVIVFAIPIALIAATWVPLESPPSRAGRANIVEQNRADDRSIDESGGDGNEEVKRERLADRERERERTENPTVATPRP